MRLTLIAALMALLAACVPARAQEIDGPGDPLAQWWEDDPASWLVLPRALMDQMPFEWREDMNALLLEWNATWELPDYRLNVLMRDERGRYRRLPDIYTDWVTPDVGALEKIKRQAR